MTAMPLPVIAGVARTVAAGNVSGGGRWSNTWHFQREDLATPDPTQMGALAVILAAYYAASPIANSAVGTTLDGVQITPLDGTSGAYSFPSPVAGSTINGSLPAECSPVLTIRSALRGRQNRGRIFLPAPARSAIENDGRMSALTTAASVTAALAMAVAADIAGWILGVASYGRSQNLVPGFTDHRTQEVTWDPHFTPYASLTMDGKLDVVRHRKG